MCQIEDRHDNRTENVVQVLRPDGQLVTRAEQYGYDVLDRLTYVNYGDGVEEHFAYDVMGNRISDLPGGAPNYWYNNANMLIARNVGGVMHYYAYDCYNPSDPNNGRGNGNLCVGDSRVIYWDSQNRMTRCE